MVLFDVLVDGVIKETIRPKSMRLEEIYKYMKEQIRGLKLKYGQNIVIERRLIY